MSLKETATQTLEILEAGYFVAPHGRQVSIEPALSKAIEGTRLYTPEQASSISLNPTSAPRVTIEVTDETTQIAARRLVESEGVSDLVLLNFASARNAGGGFINGAKAQEEDLCRCSGLYPCLLSQPAYYEVNRKNESDDFAGVFDRVVFAIFDNSKDQATISAFKQRFTRTI